VYSKELDKILSFLAKTKGKQMRPMFVFFCSRIGGIINDTTYRTSSSKQTKLSGKEEQIQELLNKKVSHSAIGRILGVNRIAAKKFVQSRRLP